MQRYKATLKYALNCSRSVFGPGPQRKYRALPNKIRERTRTYERLKHKQFDPKETDQGLPEILDNDKMQFYYKLIEQRRAENRFTRKVIPAEEKAAFVKAAKEYADWKIYSRIKDEKLRNINTEVRKNAMLALDGLPSYLQADATFTLTPAQTGDFDSEFTHQQRKKAKEHTEEEIEYLAKHGSSFTDFAKISPELRPEVLYFNQYTNMLPDEMRAQKIHDMKVKSVMYESYLYQKKATSLEDTPPEIE